MCEISILNGKISIINLWSALFLVGCYITGSAKRDLAEIYTPFLLIELIASIQRLNRTKNLFYS